MLTSILTGLLAATTATASKLSPIAANSWGPSRIDVFGLSPDNSIWHKYHTPAGFEPAGFEDFNGEAVSTPTPVSWDMNRLDYFFVGTNGSVFHRFWNSADDSWVPWPDHEELLGSPACDDFVGSVSAASWGPGRLDVVGSVKNGSYLHMYFDGSNWQGWTDFGGNFSSNPSVVASSGVNRFDIFGLSTDGIVLHKYWDGTQYQPPVDWETLPGTVKFVGTPAASTWGLPDLDLWAVGVDGALYHNYWRGSYYGGWESLGGNFTATPSVVHWAPGRIDIVGQLAGETQYRYKYFNGETWSDWQEKGGNFVTPPALTSWSADDLNILGVDGSGALMWQMWVGGQWLPAFDSYYALGNATDPFGSSEAMADAGKEQIVLDVHKQGS